MLAWLMNMGFAGGGSVPPPQPPDVVIVTQPSGGFVRRKREPYTWDKFAFPLPPEKRARIQPIIEQVAEQQIEENLTNKQALAVLSKEFELRGILENEINYRNWLLAEKQRLEDDDDAAAIIIIALNS